MTNRKREAIEWFEKRKNYAAMVMMGAGEMFELAISALKELEAIQTYTPPSDDWEHYADRLYDVAYKSGYEEARYDERQRSDQDNQRLNQHG